jgi:hypothetical protein
LSTNWNGKPMFASYKAFLNLAQMLGKNSFLQLKNQCKLISLNRGIIHPCLSWLFDDHEFVF